MPDLTSTTYLGLALKNPLVVSASPLSKSVDTVRRLEDAGAAAMVMYSLVRRRDHPRELRTGSLSGRWRAQLRREHELLP